MAALCNSASLSERAEASVAAREPTAEGQANSETFVRENTTDKPATFTEPTVTDAELTELHDALRQVATPAAPVVLRRVSGWRH